MVSGLTAALLTCVLRAGDAMQVPPQLLISVMSVEGGAIGTVAHNRNATEDLGLMQINTGAWLDLVAQAQFGGNQRDAYVRLRDDGCYNIEVGAWILSRAIASEGGDVWAGVGRYHSNTPALKRGYAIKVKEAYERLFSRPG
ncbi:lytic transglycosylase domain-containing protein [Trinickia fusca]|uniref:Lytic transglycosylase n=1 Tax=Trinickia fusca TaxID=2419777 RepID=A0A494XMS5_9BURK|nr:lytic transglycosylase domain-containing protein [Trinickia fusca]RKP51041.1 lytic transglycosylase [Trinickia fusca]